MNLGLIGFGNHLQNKIIDSFFRNKNINIKCFYSRDKTKSRKLEKKYRVEFIKDLKIFFQQEIDLVYINVPPELHYNYIKQCIKNKKNIICEKPLTMNYLEAKYLYKLAEKNKLFLFEVCQYTYHTHYKKVKEIILQDIANKSSKNRYLYASFKLPPQANDNYRMKSTNKEIIKYDLGYYTVSFIQKMFTNIKLSKVKEINFMKKNFYKNISFKSKEVSGIIEWGVGFQYSNEIAYFSDKIFISTERIFSKPSNYKPKINFIKNNNLKEIILKNENHFDKMFKLYIKIIKSKNYERYNYLKLNTINTLKLLYKI